MSIKNSKVDDYEKSTAAYFKSIKKTKPLTKQEESILWKQFHEKKDFSAREKLIKANLKFVPSVAKHFKGLGLPFADIIEEGNIGLINAIDRFDPSKDNKIISYAVWWIRKSIIEAIEKKGTLDAENFEEIKRLNSFFEEENNNTEFNSNFNINKDYLFDDIDDDSHNLNKIIEELLEDISEKDKNILIDYYGINSDNSKTLDEIGNKYNLTKERIRQINEKSLKKMRANDLLKNINY